MVTRDLQPALSRLGLTPNEIRCYVVLLETGPLSVPGLALATHLDRSNVYRAVEGLSRHGLIVQSGAAYGKKIHAASPKKLQSLAADLQRRAKKDELKVTEILPDLLGLYSAHGTKPRVQFFEGPEGIMRACDDTLEEPGVKEILTITATDFSTVPGMEDYDRRYIDRRVELGISIKILACTNQASTTWGKHDTEELRVTRFVPEKYEFPSSIYIYANKISIISHVKEKMAIIVENEELSAMHGALFMFMWENA